MKTEDGRAYDEFEISFEEENLSVEEIVHRWHRWRTSPDRSPTELKLIGLDLAERLIPQETQRQILLKVSSCRARNASLLLKVIGSVGFLSRVPWESLEIAYPDSIHPSLRLAQQPDIAVIRVANDATETAVRETGRPIRCLVASANPNSFRYPTLAWVSTEMGGLRNVEMRGGDRVKFQFLDAATEAALVTAIRDFKPDVFHFSGHADFLKSEPCLVLHGNQPGAANGFSASKLADCLIEAECQVALLLACETDGAPTSATSVLVRAGVQTVIGLQDKARDASIPAFTRIFYNAILDNVRLDRAVSEARLTIAGPQNGELLPTFWGRQATFLGSRHPEIDAARVTNLPRIEDDCIGRDRELQELQGLALGKHTLCITGLGGIGKSHLARHLAHRLQSTVPQGVWFFDGAEIRDEATLWDEFLEACYPWNPHSTAPRKALPEAIVFVDHVDEWESAQLQALIECFRGHPPLQLVLIGRAISPVSRDDRYEVGPLASGDLEATSEVLFLKWSGLDANGLEREDMRAILSIGKLLEGVPLAIRIAAARAAIVGPLQMADLLESSPLLALGGSRSRVFEAIERSISTLDENDRLLLYRISIFSGSFDWDSLKATYPDDPFELLNGIERLCEAGLTRKSREHHSTRILLTSTVRDYARQTTPDRLFFVLNLARKRHLDRFVELARGAAEAFDSGKWGEGSRGLRLDIPNFRDALVFASEKGYFEKVADLCSYLGRPLMESGRYGEFKTFLREGYRAAAELGRPSLEADLLGLDGAFAGRVGDRDRCVAQWQRRATLYQEIGDDAGLIDATLDLALETTDFDEALTLVDHADSLLTGLKRPDLEATAGVIRAKIELMRGNIDSAILVAKKSDTIELEGKYRDSLPYVQTQLGNIWAQVGRYDDAAKAYVSAVRAAIDGERRSQAAIAALGLSRTLEHSAILDKALRCAEIARDLLVNLGSRRIPEAEARIAQLRPRNYSERAVLNDPLESLREFIATLPNVPQVRFVEAEAGEESAPCSS